MPQLEGALEVLRADYAIDPGDIALNRDGGSVSYIAHADKKRYFLKAVRPAMMDTALKSADIHLYLMESGFPVPRIVRAKDGAPHVPAGGHLYILYEYIEGDEPPLGDAQRIGDLVGRFHAVMRGFTGELQVRGKHFFIDRYIDILRKKNYPKADDFKAYGDAVWEKVCGLPRGYCHGDLYRGNVHKTGSGDMYILDFDTSCEAFPMYDVMMVCNATDYFEFDERGYGRSKDVLERFLEGYLRHSALSQMEIAAFFDLIAVYHFQLQATIIEIYGLDCVDEAFCDRQLDWLMRWREQCGRGG